MPPSFSALFLLSLLDPQSPPAVHDTLIDVGGYAMHLVVHRGSQPVTVVMESGGGDDVRGWAGVDSALARRTGATVVAYDRAGFADPMNPRFVRATGDFVYSTVQRIEQPATARDTALARMVRTFPGFVRDPAGDGDLRIPVVVITAGTPWWGKPDIERAWRASHEAIAAAGPDRRLVMAEGARHLIAKERPEAIVEGVVSLMAAAQE